MALTEENGNGFFMPVAPAYNGNGNNGFGGDWAWIILLLLLGWGNNGFGGNGGFGNDYPWIANGQQNIMQNTNGGFRDAMLNDGITSIRDGINGISTQLCAGLAGVEQGANARQIANMQTAFDMQSQLASCCCENRLGIADLKYTVATENCADRAAVSDGIRDVIASQAANTQRILDQLCQDKIEQKNDIIAQLRSELMYARGQASQDVQTAAIQAGQRNLANEVEQYINPTPRPAYVVANPNCCGNFNGCGC